MNCGEKNGDLFQKAPTGADADGVIRMIPTPGNNGHPSPSLTVTFVAMSERLSSWGMNITGDLSEAIRQHINHAISNRTIDPFEIGALLRIASATESAAVSMRQIAKSLKAIEKVAKKVDAVIERNYDEG